MHVRLIRGADLRAGMVLVDARPGGSVAREIVTELHRHGESVVAHIASTDRDGRRVCVCTDAHLLVADEPTT